MRHFGKTKRKQMKMHNRLFYFIFIGLFYSCSTSKINDTALNQINGTYKANTIGNAEPNFSHYNFVSLLNRKLIKDTLRNKPIFNYQFEIRIEDKKHLEISIINENNKIVSTKKYRFKRKEENIILKNKNTKPILIPYLAGALDVTKLRIKTDENRNLLVLINQHRSGGAFLIPMGWSNTETSEKYERLK
jgi:hypothetical protein